MAETHNSSNDFRLRERNSYKESIQSQELIFLPANSSSYSNNSNRNPDMSSYEKANLPKMLEGPLQTSLEITKIQNRISSVNNNNYISQNNLPQIRVQSVMENSNSQSLENQRILASHHGNIPSFSHNTQNNHNSGRPEISNPILIPRNVNSNNNHNQINYSSTSIGSNPKPIPEHTKLFRKDALTGFENRGDDDRIGMVNRLRYVCHYDYRSILFNFTAVRKAIFLCNSGKSDAPGSRASIDKNSLKFELDAQEKLLYLLKSRQALIDQTNNNDSNLGSLKNSINDNKPKESRTITPLAKPTDRFVLESLQKEPFLPNYHSQMKINRRTQSRGYHCIINCPEGSVVLEDALADIVSGTDRLKIPSTDELSLNMQMYSITKNSNNHSNNNNISNIAGQGFPLIEDLSSQYLRTHFNLTTIKSDSIFNSFSSNISPKLKKKDFLQDAQDKLLKSNLSSNENNIENHPNFQYNVSENSSPTLHYVGNDPKFGPICISLFRFWMYSKLNQGYHAAYRICVRTVDHDQTLRATVLESVMLLGGN